jgi:hypothetical protein
MSGVTTNLLLGAMTCSMCTTSPVAVNKQCKRLRVGLMSLLGRRKHQQQHGAVEHSGAPRVLTCSVEVLYCVLKHLV